MKDIEEEYFKHVEKSFEPGSYSRAMYRLIFISQLNSYALQFNPIIIGPGDIRHPMSLITLVLSGSGSGKDSAIKFLEPLRNKVDEMCAKIFETKKEALLFEEEQPNAQDGMNFTAAKPHKMRKKPLSETLSSDHVAWVKSATDAGLNMYYSTYSALGFGSIGLNTSEFGQDFQDKGFVESLEKILELYDSPSKTAARITNEKGAIILEGTQSSCTMHGSFDEFLKNDKMIERLQTYLATSMARRALFVNISDDENLSFFEHKVKANRKKLEIIKGKVLTDDERRQAVKTEKTNKHIQKLIEKVYHNVLEKYGSEFISYNKINSNGNLEKPKLEIKFSRGAEILLLIYQSTMDQKVLDIVKSGRVVDKRLRIEIQSRPLKAMRIAGMSAFYDGRKIISEEDIEYGMDVTNESGKYFEQISKPNIIVEDVCSHLLKSPEKITVRDLEAAEIIPLNMSKYRLNDLFERCAEELYQQNKIFRSTMGNGGMIGQIWIENLIETDGNIAKISYSTQQHEGDTFMKTASIPIDKILDIPDIKKIGVSGFKNSSRSISNVCGLGNVLIYDLDDGKMSIREAQEALRGLTGFIYPTRNHMKEKVTGTTKDPMGNDIVEKKPACPRFRIVLLCKQHFPQGGGDSNSEYKQLYKNVAMHFNIPFDTAAAEIARFFWVPDNAKRDIVKKAGKIDGDKLLDLTYFIPELKAFHDIQSKSTILNSRKYWDNMSVREILERALKNEKIKGRNSALFSMAMNLFDKNVSEKEIQEHIYDINEKFDSPLDTDEIEKSILSSLAKKFYNK